MSSTVEGCATSPAPAARPPPSGLQIGLLDRRPLLPPVPPSRPSRLLRAHFCHVRVRCWSVRTRSLLRRHPQPRRPRLEQAMQSRYLRRHQYTWCRRRDCYRTSAPNPGPLPRGRATLIVLRALLITCAYNPGDGSIVSSPHLAVSLRVVDRLRCSRFRRSHLRRLARPD